MKLLRYIKGLRTGREAHLIELEAMKDFFLSEALDGYDSVEDNHLKRITCLQKNIKSCVLDKTKMIAPKSKSKPVKSTIVIPWKRLSIAATLLICLSLGGYYFYKNYELFSSDRLFVSSGSQKKTENIARKQDTIIMSQQDTMIIYMPESPLLRKDLIASAQTLQERLRDAGREVEIVKLEANQIQLPATIDISHDYIGFEHKELPPDTDKLMMIAMNESTQTLGEVVVTGYGARKRSDIIGSVAKIEIEKVLEGRVAGVSINSEKPIKPEPEMGMKAYKNYLKAHVIQPTDSICKGVRGKVKLRFWINEEGNPHNIQVVKSLCKTADAEAIRLLQSGGKWKYGSEAVEIEVSF